MVRIGTRGSRLALAQAREVADRLALAGVETELVPMATSDGQGVTASTPPSGVKGLFVAEIVRALQAGEVDLAVHSAKDLPSEDPDGLTIVAVPRRAAPVDVLVTRAEGLPDGGTVGTSSLRRRAQYLRLRPAAVLRDLRGNVDTRLRRLEEGRFDGLILAAAGLERLGVAPSNVSAFAIDDMVPAPGQGALAVQGRTDDRTISQMVKILDHIPSRTAFEAERGLVARVGGGCALPLGAYAELRPAGVRLLAVVVQPDGSNLVRAEAEMATPGAVADAVAASLLARGAGDILAQVETRA